MFTQIPKDTNRAQECESSAMWFQSPNTCQLPYETRTRIAHSQSKLKPCHGVRARRAPTAGPEGITNVHSPNYLSLIPTSPSATQRRADESKFLRVSSHTKSVLLFSAGTSPHNTQHRSSRASKRPKRVQHSRTPTCARGRNEMHTHTHTSQSRRPW